MTEPHDSEARPLIVGLTGSLRTGSHTMKALKVALAGAEAAGARTHICDSLGFHLPFCDGEGNKGDRHVEEFRRLVKHCHGLVLCSPEYHGSYSGVLKNMLDLLSSDELRDKVCGLVSVLGGQSNSNALNHLRITLRAVHAWVIPHQAAVANTYSAFNEDDSIKDARLQDRVLRVGADVVKYSKLLNPDYKAQNGTEE